MSGIAGIIRFDGGPVEPGQIEKMTGAMSYRGPDGINHRVVGPVALGQCMFRTTSESLEETQPLTNEEESLVLVMDGWLSNWKELRAELLAKSVRLRTRADAELVLRAYEAWGADSLAHIEGDFAFVIWDARRGEAFCARDRLGNKPFFYHWNEKQLIFASELTPVLEHPSTPETPNEGMIAEFLASQWFTRDETLWAGIFRLVAAHKMSATGRGLKIERYWSPDLSEALPFRRDEEYFEHYRELFADCVRRASRSQSPVAYEVSGGLDSSAIFCMAEKLRHDGRLPAPGADGYTLDFTGDQGADEMHYARSVGRHLGRTIHEAPPFMPPAAWYADHARVCRDFPGFPNGAMVIGLDQQMAPKHRVALNGLGGDEFLDGSRLYYVEHLLQGQWRQLYQALRRDIDASGRRQAVDWLVRCGIVGALPRPVQQGLRKTKQILTAGRGRGDNPSDSQSLYWLTAEMRRHVADRRQRSELHSRQLRCTAVHRGLLKSLNYPFSDHAMELTDRVSSMGQIERRAPMRDHRFVQFAFSTPEQLRLRGNVSKFIHRQALRDLLPDSVRERTDKAEFSLVFWNQLCEIIPKLSGPIARERRQWVTPAGVDTLYRELSREGEHFWPAWILWSLYGCHISVGSGTRFGR